MNLDSILRFFVLLSLLSL